MKIITLLFTILFGLGSTVSAYATGTLGGNPSCDSGAVHVGHAPCGKKTETDKPKK